jgi:hypothetical protein
VLAPPHKRGSPPRALINYDIKIKVTEITGKCQTLMLGCKHHQPLGKKMYSFEDVDFATEILLDEVFAFDEFEQEFELDDEMPEDAGMEGYLFGWDS